MLFHVNDFRRAVYDIPVGDEKLQSSTTLALQNVFHQLQVKNENEMHEPPLCFDK